LDAIDIDLTLDLDIVLPSCLKWYSADETITKKGDTLNLVVDYNPSANKAINITPICTGLDFSDVTFTTENEQDGSTNKADRILKYATDLKIEGSIALNGIKIKPELLTNKIAFNAELAVGEITPKAFHLTDRFSSITSRKFDFDIFTLSQRHGIGVIIKNAK
jgi:hypothetical protein